MNHNYCIIMAGGVGSRFWPYSRNRRPKQFLDFFGTGRSLLQLTVDRLRGLVPVEHILVATNALYKDLVLEHIPDLPPRNVLLEPCRRNTAPCIAYAATRIAVEDQDANILVAASDHLITDEQAFRKTLEAGLQYVADHEDIVTLGMKPTRAETGYGYIQLSAVSSQPAEFEDLKIQKFENSAKSPNLQISKSPAKSSNLQISHVYDRSERSVDKKSSNFLGGVNGDAIFKVKQFREKPDIKTAEQYLASGDYLWNSGMFLFSVRTIVAAFKQHLPEVWKLFEDGKNIMGTDREQDYINERFPLCENISIDYGIMEKAHNVMVMPADFGWSDVGTWGSLYELQQSKDDNGNAVINAEADFYNSRGNIVTLEKGKLAVIEGLEDYIVAESDGVLLICRRQNEQQIRQFVANAPERFL